MIRRLLAVLLLAALPAVAAGDTLLQLETHQDAYQIGGRDQPAQDGKVEVWIGKDHVSRSDGRTTVVYLGAEKRLLVVNHPTKSYSYIDLPVDFAKLMPKGMEEMAEMMKMTAEVTATDETRKIGDWNAHRYDLTMTNAMGLAIETTMWTTRDIAIDYDAYEELSRQMLMLQPGGSSIVEQLSTVDGFPVEQTTKIDLGGTSFETREELVSVEEKAAPAGTYGVPEGYAEKDLAEMAGAGGPGPGGR